MRPKQNEEEEEEARVRRRARGTLKNASTSTSFTNLSLFVWVKLSKRYLKKNKKIREVPRIKGKKRRGEKGREERKGAPKKHRFYNSVTAQLGGMM
jgi:hypothetical protein